MSSKGIIAVVAIAVIGAAVAFWAIDVDVGDDGRLPTANVDVDVKGGKLPSVDVDTVDVDVGSKKRTITVPDVDVKMKDTTIKLPTVEVTPPGDANSADQKK